MTHCLRLKFYLNIIIFMLMAFQNDERLTLDLETRVLERVKQEERNIDK